MTFDELVARAEWHVQSATDLAAADPAARVATEWVD